MVGGETSTPDAVDRPLALREIIAVFLVAGLVIMAGWQLVGEASLARQMVVWVANIAMLLVVWWGLCSRGQSWRNLGLSWEPLSGLAMLRGVLISLLILVLALAAFVAAGGLAPYLAPYLGSPQQQSDLSAIMQLLGSLSAIEVPQESPSQQGNQGRLLGSRLFPYTENEFLSVKASLFRDGQ